MYTSTSEARLRRELEGKGLYILSLRRAGAFAGFSFKLPDRSRVPTREFLVFNQELATLLKAGMPLVPSLDLLRRRVEIPVFRLLLDDVYERVRSGTALSEAFDAHAGLVPSVYTASLLAGERSGSLDTVIRRFVDYTKVVSGVKKRMLSALMYPAILIGLALFLVGIIVFKVVPEFADFYRSFGAELPLMTRVIVGVSTTVRDQLLLVAAGAALVVAAILWWVRLPGQRERLDGVILRVPMLGDVARKFATSQMARTLATLLGGGLPLVNALEIAAKSIGNRRVAREVYVVAERVREGESLSTAMDRRGVFPDVAVKMAEVGESTGALQEMLHTVADFYDDEISTTMERFVTLVEPALLVVMGIVIAGLLLALYMPLFQLNSVLG